MFPLTCRKKLRSVGEKLFLFLSAFYVLISGQNCLLGLNFNSITIKPINNELKHVGRKTAYNYGTVLAILTFLLN